jgi:hypothetical protein
MQQQPPQQSPQPEQQGGGGEVQQLVETTYAGLQQLMEIVSGASPELAEKFQAVVQGFQMVIEALVKGGGEPPQQSQGPRGPSAGGPGAVPAM